MKKATISTGSATTSSSAAIAWATTAASATKPKHQQPMQIITTHGTAEVAALPLLQPFQIRKPNESSIINTIINEQHAADTLAAVMKQEEKLRSDLQKAKNENDDDHHANDKTNSNNGNGNGNGNNGKSAATGKAGGATTAKRSKKSSKKNATNSEKVKELENRIDALALTLLQCRTNLSQFAGWTKAMLQAEYSKIAVTLDPDSRRYEDLEEAFNFLCPRLNTAEGPEDYYHEQRLVYVKEMIPVMKKVGEKNFATSLIALPYLTKFQCSEPDSPIIGALIDEMHQVAITEGVRVRLEKQVNDPAKFKVLKHAEEWLEHKEIVTTEFVRKHYRKRSIKLHPDRNGEHMRPVFEEFTDARNVLSDVKLRQSYLRGMLDVFKYYGTSMMSESHEAWNKKHRPDKAEGDVTRRGNQKGEGKTMRLEGGLHQQVPKGVMLHHRRDGKKNHVVSVSVNVLRPVHEFYARVRTIKLEMRDTLDAVYVTELSRREIVSNIKFDRQGPILANEIPVVEMTLNPGHWEVFWRATLDTVGTDPLNPENATENESITTRSSATASFHVVDYDNMQKAQDFHLAENTCKVVKGELANTLHKLRTNQLDSASMTTTARFGHYHQVLVRARKKCSNLHRLMALTGRSSSVHDSLRSLLTESRQVFAELEHKADAAQKRKDKKDDVKRFKAFIASVLESEDPFLWMKGIDEARLYREGGDINRLYQLFIEGKGKYVLMVDSEMYKEAAKRDDIFSTKQCKDLAVRGEEVAVLESKEEEEAAAAEEKRKKDEDEREKLMREAELRDKWSMVGQNATIQGLTSEKGKTLNHQMARIMYYNVDKQRFEVQPYNSEEKVMLKKGNLTIYYGFVPKQKQQHRQPSSPNRNIAKADMSARSLSSQKARGGAWNCNQCTFENDDASVECSMCSNPRAKGNSKDQQASVDKKEEKKEDIVLGEGPIHETPSPPEEKVDKSSPKINSSDSVKTNKTIYVRSSHSKKLTGKRGRKKKDLMNKSGAEDIQIGTSAIGNHVPVRLTGTKVAVLKAIALIQEAIGMENVDTEGIIKLHDLLPPKPAAPTPAVISPPLSKAPAAPPPNASIAQPAPAENEPVINTKHSHTGFNSGLFSGFDKPANTFSNGIHQYVSMSESETQPTSQYSFGDALLPRGLMDMSISTPGMSVPPELPSEIGITSQGMARESITEASVSSLNDRSNVSKTTYSTFTLNENDPLLIFLRLQQTSIKGSVDEFYTWLVKSEDIDTMVALKEAVSDEDYLNDSMKHGNGVCGLKGFKRKAFQRAVSEYEEPEASATISSPFQKPVSNASTPMHGMNGNAFLPTNLFGNDDPSPGSFSDPPEELVCPIGLVLMTVDPVLAADGVTYERSSIENWFRTNIANIQMAQENLKNGRASNGDQRLIENGIRSPAYGTMMKHLALTPNNNVRNMARAHQERKEAACF